MSDRPLPEHTSTSAENVREWLVPAESTPLGLRHPIVWSAPGRAVMIQRVEPGPLTADEADRLGDALHGAAAYVRQGPPMPDPQIIRTDDEYEALDPDSLVLDHKGRIRPARSAWSLPVVVVATGEHVRACRATLEGETPDA